MASAAAAAARPLHLLTINVNGLNSDPGKRRQLFHTLRSRRWDIVLLQEVHAANDGQAAGWAADGAAAGQPWEGECFWSHGTAASRGVGVLIKAGAPVSEARVGYRDGEGRLLRVDFSYAGQRACVLSVYAPCEAADRPAFFQGPFSAALPPLGAADA